MFVAKELPFEVRCVSFTAVRGGDQMALPPSGHSSTSYCPTRTYQQEGFPEVFFSIHQGDAQGIENRDHRGRTCGREHIERARLPVDPDGHVDIRVLRPAILSCDASPVDDKAQKATRTADGIEVSRRQLTC
jgi:hypothetical protein